MSLTPDLILSAYCQGLFPMADGRDGEIGWYSPDPRAIQPFVQGDPLGSFHVKHSLAKQVRKHPFEITTDHCFARVIHHCATVQRQGETGTWISPNIEALYFDLHSSGFAHSVEAWHQGELSGGIYGVTIGSVFFGESMFSLRPNASQIAYVWLVEHLRERGYTLFDVQFTNAHIEQFGVVEVPKQAYMQLLQRAIEDKVSWADA
ncbi:MAG: leucyl/phenylalanyl-tRNA--protein transferase [Planctomycetota bacterium]